MSKIKIIQLAQKTMPAIARNIGAKNASGDILLFLDSDTYLAQDWISKMLVAYRDGHLVGSGSVSLPPFQKRKFIPLAEYFLLSNTVTDSGICRENKFLNSNNLFCDRALFEKVRGFPHLWAFEDTAFGLNASAVEKVWFIPELRACHIFRQNLSRFLKKQKFRGKSNIVYRRRYYNYFIYRGIILLLLLPFFIYAKFIIISLRVFRSGIGNTFRFFVASPVFLLGLFFWGFGFARGCLDKDTFRNF